MGGIMDKNLEILVVEDENDINKLLYSIINNKGSHYCNKCKDFEKKQIGTVGEGSR